METFRSSPAASAEEAAAIIAALEQFMRDTTPPVSEQGTEPAASPWKRAALVEGVFRSPGLPELPEL